MAMPAPAPSPVPGPTSIPVAFSGGFTKLHLIAVCGFCSALGLGVLTTWARRVSPELERVAQLSLARLSTPLARLLPGVIGDAGIAEAVLLVRHSACLARQHPWGGGGW